MGHGSSVPTVGNSASIRSNARHRRRLASSTRWSIVDVVVASHFAFGSAAACGNSWYHEFGEEIESDREDSRSHGAEAVDSDSCTLGRNDHFLEHMSRRGWHNRNDSLCRPTVLKKQGSGEREKEQRKKVFKVDESFRSKGFRHSLDVQSTCRIAY